MGPVSVVRHHGQAEFDMLKPHPCVGIDGCPGGWVVAGWIDDSQWSFHVDETISAVCQRFMEFKSLTIGIDMPIGLPDSEHGLESGIRQCDVVARRLLKFPRSSSVFSAPVRPVLELESGNVAEVHARASAITESISGKKVTRQTVNILPRIRELDVFLQHHSEWRSRVHEVHPELSFRAMAGQSMEHGKKSMEGRQEREAAIRSHLGEEPIHLARAAFKQSRARDDDVLDALACLWTARRLAEGVHDSLPEDPEFDATGLPMAIHV